MRTAHILGPISLVALSVGGAGAATPPPVVVKNLGLASSASPLLDSDTYAVFRVLENAQGADLDGDGLLQSAVHHVLDKATGIVTPLPHVAAPHLSGSTLAFSRSEKTAQADLNGDGDQLDHVAAVLDLTSGLETSLGLASGDDVLVGEVLTDGALVALAVDEWSQGAADLNGNGTPFERVVHAVDLATGSVVNTTFTITPTLGQFTVFGGRWVVALRSEVEEGPTDLNGDGDTFDILPFFHDVQTGTSTSLGLSVGFNSFVIDPPRIALLPFEAPADLNGDGDVSDRVLHLIDLSTGAVTNVALPAIEESIRFIGGRLVFLVLENSHGQTDLNGDGDAIDRVLHVHDPATGLTTNLALHVPFGATGDANLLAFSVLEGAADLNGDGDLSDRVLHVHRFSPPGTTNLGVAGDPVWLHANRVVLRTPDLAIGPDLGAYDVVEDSLTTLGISYPHTAAGDGPLLANLAGPSEQILRIHHVPTAATIDVPLPTTFARVNGSTVLFEVEEKEVGLAGADLNGDGDVHDLVLHVATVAPSSCGSVDSYGDGCAGPTAQVPELVVTGCPRPTFTQTVSILRSHKAAVGLILVGTAQTTVPLVGTGGCVLRVGSPLPSAIGPTPVGFFGEWHAPFEVPAAATAGTVTLQAFLVHPDGTFANTNGVSVTIQP